MKTLLITLLASCLVLFGARAQTTVPAYVDLLCAYDTDAEAFFATAKITDPVEQARLTALVMGLKQMNLWTNCVQLLTLRTNQNAGFGNTAYPIKGNLVSLSNSPTWAKHGLDFTNGTQFGWFTNPMQSASLTAYTVALGFAATTNGTVQSILSSYEPLAIGPAFYVNSSAQQGAYHRALLQDWSTNGTSSPGFSGYQGRVAKKTAVTTTNQFAIFRNSSSGFAIYPELNFKWFTETNVSPPWCNGATFRIGLSITNTGPLNGHVSFVGMWTKDFSDAEANALRMLMARTALADYLPSMNIYMEGDSLTHGDVIGTEQTFGEQLLDTSLRGKIAIRWMSLSGDTVSNMQYQVVTNLLPYARHGVDYSPYQLYSLWGGANDINSASTALEIWGYITNALWRARSAGFRTAVSTIIPSGGIQPLDQKRIDLNNLIRAGSGRYDFLVDLAALPTLQDTNSAYFHTDHIHLTTEGHREVMKEWTRSVRLPQP